MKTWWIGAVLTALGLAQFAAVRAQYPPPAQGALPEPAPESVPDRRRSPLQDAPPVPGPMSGQLAPTGPANDLSLPATIPTAWGQGPMPEQGVYFNAGAMYLQRQQPGHNPIVLRDNTPTPVLGTVPFLRNTSVVQDIHDLHPDLAWGPRGTLGCLFDNTALELTGFYLPDTSCSVTTEDPGRLLLFFQNAPSGFQGLHGLWLQADRAVTTLRSRLSSGEMNFRWWNRAQTDIEGILGIRYIDLQERVSIFTGENDLTIVDPVNLEPLPANQATYSMMAHNHIVGPQLGFEFYLPLRKWAFLGLQSKGTWGANFVDTTARLKRGDDVVVGIDEQRHAVVFSQVYEVSAFVDILTLDRLRLRGGYSAMLLLGVDEAASQINYDLSQPFNRSNDHGSIFYHGALVELQFFF